MKNVFLVLTLILIMQVGLRLPFMQVPLERDEGGYGYIAQRMIAGDIVYKDTVDNKPPLIYFVYMGIVKMFGNSILSIRIPTLIYSLLTTVAVFGVGYFWLGSSVGLVSAFLFALFSGGPNIQGAMSNIEVFMSLPLLLALISLLIYSKNRNIWLMLIVGLLSGIAVLFKQIALFNFIVILVAVFFLGQTNMEKCKSLSVLSLGFLIPILSLTAYFLTLNNLHAAIFSIIGLNKEYLNALPGTIFSRTVYGLDVIRSQMLLENSIIWLLSISALIFIVFKDRSFWNLTILSWTLLPFAAMFASGRFFGHYFIQFIPVLSLLSAYALKKIKDNSNFYLIVALAIALALPVINSLRYQIPFYWAYTPNEIANQMYGNMEFAVSKTVADELSKSIKPEDRILVWSANPEIYFYLNKRSPTKYFNYLAWLKTDARDEEIAKSVIDDRPTYIIKSTYSMPNKKMFEFIGKNYGLFLKAGDAVVYKIKKHS